jgi:hypothetical protein
VDCGGPTCPKCPAGSSCNSGTDCSTNVCYQSSCCAPKDCTTQGLTCGAANDTCGNPLTCGNCSNSLQCQSGHCTCVANSCPFCLGTPCCVSSTQCGCRAFGFLPCQ